MRLRSLWRGDKRNEQKYYEWQNLDDYVYMRNNNRVRPHLTKDKGFGLRAQRPFRSGQTVTQGTVLLLLSTYRLGMKTELSSRYSSLELSPTSRRAKRLADLMRLTGHGDPANARDLRRFADRYAFVTPDSIGNVAPTRAALFSWEISLINHACEPNATLQPSPDDDDRYNVVASRDIEQGEEITISYNYMKNRSGGRFKCKCQTCEAKSSRWQCVML